MGSLAPLHKLKSVCCTLDPQPPPPTNRALPNSRISPYSPATGLRCKLPKMACEHSLRAKSSAFLRLLLFVRPVDVITIKSGSYHPSLATNAWKTWGSELVPVKKQRSRQSLWAAFTSKKTPQQQDITCNWKKEPCYFSVYTHIRTEHTLHLSMCRPLEQVGSIWVNECLFLATPKDVSSMEPTYAYYGFS